MPDPRLARGAGLSSLARVNAAIAVRILGFLDAALGGTGAD
jgi:hypothetical protein